MWRCRPIPTRPRRTASGRPWPRPPEGKMTLLVGDVGGTKTQLALVEPGSGVVREGTLHSHDFPTLEEAVGKFLADGPRVEIAAACFGVAGPVTDGRVKTTNLPWELDEQRLTSEIPARRVRLVNDLVAMGEGMLALPAASFQSIQIGECRGGTMALIAAGTGLGEDPVCVHALDIFVSIYGAEAGNLALKSLSLGGVIIGGGIGPKIRSKLANGLFSKAFCDKGRFSALMASIPVRLALDPKAPLLGAARVAASLMEEGAA